MINGGRRIATATGAMLADPACLGNLPPDAGERLFDPEYWRARHELQEVRGGRGAAWFIASADRQWALRQCRRGGLIARLSRDLYVWAGEHRVRAFAEWRLLELMAQRGLPVPQPVAARYRRAGLFYRCDLITRRIIGAEPLSALLQRGSLPEPWWRAIGGVIARLHAAGVDHADLNAHNILVDGGGFVSVIDFDRGRLREPVRGSRAGAEPGARVPGWALRNLQRLRRSLVKISGTTTGQAGLAQLESLVVEWNWLVAGYQDAWRVGATRDNE